jgi:hypothetical protein
VSTGPRLVPGRTALAAALALLLALAACQSPEELRAADEAACAGYGFRPGTSDFANCLQRESLARRYAVPPPGWYGPGWVGPGWVGPGWYPPPPGMLR